MKLIEVNPPYKTGQINCDEDNPNVWDVELWNKWLKSIDYYKTDWSRDLISTELLIAIYGHRGVRIRKHNESEYTWYYNIIMGYKIEE